MLLFVGVVLCCAAAAPFGVDPEGPFLSSSWLKKSASMRSLATVVPPGVLPMLLRLAGEADPAFTELGTDGRGNWGD